MDNFDILFATKLSTINQHLASSADMLPSGCLIDKDGCTGKVSFGLFSLAAGPSYTSLLLTVQIAKGEVRFGTAKPVDLGGTSVTYEMTLKFCSDALNSSATFLRFDCISVGSTPADGALAPHSSTFGPRLTPMETNIVETGIGLGLVANNDKIGYDIAALFDTPGTKAWLKPQIKTYICAQPDDEEAVFAVLLDSYSEDAYGFDASSAANVLANGAPYALALSPYLFMEHVFLSGLAKSLGAKPDNFDLSNDGVIKNTRDIGMGSVKVGLIKYHPKITSVTAEIQDVNIRITVKGKCDMGDKLTLTFTGVNEALVRCDSKGDLTFEHQKGYPTFSHDVSERTKGPPSVIAWIADWIGNGIGESIAKSLKSEATTTDVISDAPTYVKWAGTGGFAPEMGGLETFFYLTGNATN